MNLKFFKYFIVLIILLASAITFSQNALAVTCYVGLQYCDLNPPGSGYYVPVETDNSLCILYAENGPCDMGCCCEGIESGYQTMATCSGAFYSYLSYEECDAECNSLGNSFTLSGTVLSNGNSISGATVTLSNGVTTRTTTSDNNGNYLFTNVELDQYTLTAQFGSCSATISGIVVNQNTNQDITLICQTYSVTGHIYNQGNTPVSNAIITTNIDGLTATSSSDGFYSLQNILPTTNLQITASNGGCSGFREVTVNTNLNNIDITLSCQLYTISGTIFDTANNPVNDATVTSSRSSTAYITGPNGVYAFSNLAPGAITITASSETQVSTYVTRTCIGTLYYLFEGEPYTITNQNINLASCCTRTQTISPCSNGVRTITISYTGICSDESYTYTENCGTSNTACEWECSEWGDCIDGSQTRDCEVVVINGCNPEAASQMPPTVRNCGLCGNGELDAFEGCDYNSATNDFVASSDCLNLWEPATIEDMQQNPGTFCNLPTCQCLSPPIIPEPNPCELNPGEIGEFNVNTIFLEPYFDFEWFINEDCKDYIEKFELSYCDNTSGGCLGPANYQSVNNSIDKSLRAHTKSNKLTENRIYCYELKVIYDERVKPDVGQYFTTKISCKTSGDYECINNIYGDNEWCNSTGIVECSQENIITELEPCPQGQYCSIIDGEAQCILQGSCSICNNIFGLFSYQNIYVNDNGNTLQCPSFEYPSPKTPDWPAIYGKEEFSFGCYLDYSYSSLDKVYDCTNVASCYDYLSKDSCQNDYCEKFNNSQSDGTLAVDCEWIPYTNLNGAIESKYDKGICRPKSTSLSLEQDCSKCNENNLLFPVCTRDICTLQGDNCYYFKSQYSADPVCADSSEIKCPDYESKEDCIGEASIAAYTEVTWDANQVIKIDGTNILTKSQDIAGKGVCQWDDTKSKCFRNADNNLKKDCEMMDSEQSLICEKDVIAPTTTILNEAIYGSMIDLTGKIYVTDNEEWTLGDDITGSLKQNIFAYYCVRDVEDEECYPNKIIPVSGPNAYKLNLSDFFNPLQPETKKYNLSYFSEDPSKNLELIKSFEFDLDPYVNVSLNYSIKSFNISQSQWRTNITFNLTLVSTETDNVECSFRLRPSPLNTNYNTLLLAFKNKEVFDIPSILDPNNNWMNNTENYNRLSTTYPDLSDGLYDYEMYCIDIVDNYNNITGNITIDGDLTITNPNPYNEKFTNNTNIVPQLYPFPGLINITTNATGACKYSTTTQDYTSSDMKFFDGEDDTSENNSHTANIAIPQISNGVGQSGIYVYYVACNLTINGEKGIISGSSADNPFFMIDNLVPKTTLMYANNNLIKEYNSSVPAQETLTLYLNCSDKDLSLEDVNGNSLAFGCDSTRYYCIPAIDGTRTCEDETDYTEVGPNGAITLDYSGPNGEPSKQLYGSNPLIYYYSKDIGGNNEFGYGIINTDTMNIMQLQVRNMLFSDPIIIFDNESYSSSTGGITIYVDYTTESNVNLYNAQIISTNANPQIIMDITPQQGTYSPTYTFEIPYLPNAKYKLILNASDDDGNKNNNASSFTISHSNNSVRVLSPGVGVGTEPRYTINLTTTFPSTCKYSINDYTDICDNSLFCKYNTIPNSNILLPDINRRIHSFVYDGQDNFMNVICRTDGTLEIPDNSNSAFASTKFPVGYLTTGPNISITYIHKPNVTDPTYNIILNSSYNSTTIKLFTNQSSICTIYANFTDSSKISANIIPPRYFNGPNINPVNYSQYKFEHTYFINYTYVSPGLFEYNITCINYAALNTTTVAEIILNPDNTAPTLELNKIESQSYFNLYTYNVTCIDHCTNTYQYKRVSQNAACGTNNYITQSYADTFEVTNSTKICLIGKDLLGRTTYKEENITLIPFDKGMLTILTPYQYIYVSNNMNSTRAYAPQYYFDLSVSTEPLNATCKYVPSAYINELGLNVNTQAGQIYSVASFFDYTSNYMINRSIHNESEFVINSMENIAEAYIIICLAKDLDPEETDPYIRREVLFYWDNTSPIITVTHPPNIYDWNNRLSINISILTNDDTMCVLNDTYNSNLPIDLGDETLFNSYTKNHTYKYFMPQNFSLQTNETVNFNVTCINRAKYSSTVNSSIHYEITNSVIVNKINSGSPYPGDPNDEIHYGQASSGTKIPIRIDTNIMSTCTLYFDYGSDNVFIVPINSSNRLNHNINVTSYIPGVHTIRVYCNVPENNNIGSDEIIYNIYADVATPQIISLTSPREVNSTCNLETFSVNVLMSDDVGIFGYDYTITGPQGFTTVSETVSPSANFATITYNGALEDTKVYTVTVTAIDLAGKRSSPSIIRITANSPTQGIACDSLPPIVSFSNVEYFGSNNNVVTLNVDCMDNNDPTNNVSASGCTLQFKYAFMPNQNDCYGANYNSLGYYTKKLIFFNSSGTLCVRGEDAAGYNDNKELYLNISPTVCGNNVIDIKPTLYEMNITSTSTLNNWNASLYNSIKTEECDGIDSINALNISCLTQGYISGNIACNMCEIDTTDCGEGINVWIISPLPFGIGQTTNYNLIAGSEYDATCKYGELTNSNDIIVSYNAMNTIMHAVNETNTEHQTPINVASAMEQYYSRNIICHVNDLTGFTGPAEEAYGIKKAYIGYDNTAPIINVITSKINDTINDWNDRSIDIIVNSNEPVICTINDVNYDMFDNMIISGAFDDYTSYKTNNQLNNITYNTLGNIVTEINYSITCTNRAGLSTITEKIVYYAIDQYISITKLMPVNEYSTNNKAYYKISTNVLTDCTINNGTSTINMSGKSSIVHDSTIYLANGWNIVTIVCNDPTDHAYQATAVYNIYGSATSPINMNIIADSNSCGLDTINAILNATKTSMPIAGYHYTITDFTTNTQITTGYTSSGILSYSPSNGLIAGHLYKINAYAVDTLNNPSSGSWAIINATNSNIISCDYTKPTITITEIPTGFMDITKAKVSCADTGSGCADTYQYQIISQDSECNNGTYVKTNTYSTQITLTNSSKLCVKGYDRNNNYDYAEKVFIVTDNNYINITPISPMVIRPNTIITTNPITDITFTTTTVAECRYSLTAPSTNNISMLYDNYVPFNITLTQNLEHKIIGFNTAEKYEQYMHVICKVNSQEKPYSAVTARIVYVNSTPTINTLFNPTIISDWNNRKTTLHIDTNQETVCVVETDDGQHNNMLIGDETDATTYTRNKVVVLDYSVQTINEQIYFYKITCKNLAQIENNNTLYIDYNLSNDLTINMLNPNIFKSSTVEIISSTNMISSCEIYLDYINKGVMNRDVTLMNHEKTFTGVNSGSHNVEFRCIAPIIGLEASKDYDILVNTTVIRPICGDGIVQKPNSNNKMEDCDGTNLNGRSCTSGFVGKNYSGGELKCNACSYDFSSCDTGNGWCGDDKVQGPNSQGLYEQCDDDIENGLDCENLGFKSGSLSCSNCMINTSRCVQDNGILGNITPICNNNILETREQCEIGGAYDVLCSDFGYKDGTVTCGVGCIFDLRSCNMYEDDENFGGRRCGNNVVESGEQCDGTTGLSLVTCNSLGNFIGGIVTCTNTCVYNTSKCISTNNTGNNSQNTCSNNVKDGTETDFNCGGTCPKCSLNKTCISNNDCTSGKCFEGKCVIDTCNNNKLDSDSETDVDCGNKCSPCKLSKLCSLGTDCESGICTDGICMSDPCTNGFKDDNEIDTDCGGNCMLCDIGQNCNSNEDCMSNNCVDNLCDYESVTKELNLIKLIIMTLGIVLILGGSGYIIYKTFIEKKHERSKFAMDMNFDNNNKDNQNKQAIKTPELSDEQKEAIAKQKDALDKKRQSRIQNRKNILQNLDDESSATGKVLAASKTKKDNVLQNNTDSNTKSTEEYIDLSDIKTEDNTKDKKETLSKLKNIADKSHIYNNELNNMQKYYSKNIYDSANNSSVQKSDLVSNDTMKMLENMDRDTIMSGAFSEVLSDLLNQGKITKQNVSNILFEYMDAGILSKSDVAKISSELKII